MHICICTYNTNKSISGTQLRCFVTLFLTVIERTTVCFYSWLLTCCLRSFWPRGGDRLDSLVSCSVFVTCQNTPARECPAMFDLSRGWNLSFAGCGFLGIYHIGVASCLLEKAPYLIKEAAKLYGASAGALTASMLASNAPIGKIQCWGSVA